MAGRTYDISEGSRGTWASIQIFSPYVDEGTMRSIDETRTFLTDVRNSYVEAATTDGDVVVPFDIVDAPGLGDGALLLPSRPEGHGCDVYVPITDDRTFRVYVDNGEEEGDLEIADPALACRTALAVASSLKG